MSQTHESHRRASKRRRVTTATRDRVALNDDYQNIVSYREEGLTSSRNLLISSERVEQHIPSSSWNNLDSWLPSDNVDVGLEFNDTQFDQAIDMPVMDGIPPLSDKKKTKKKKTRLARRPHVYWQEIHRETYLNEQARSEGRGDARTVELCPDCLVETPEFRCKDCFLPDLKWNSIFFQKTSLKALGLKVQLGHLNMQCSKPLACHSSLRIIHTNGIHDVNILFCGCTNEDPKHIQLLRRGLYPASQVDPRTCVTFRLLQLLHLLTVTSKMSAHDQYRTIARLTDNLGLHVPKSRGRALFRTTVQWRHLKLLKRGGRAHSPSGARNTKDGELAILCPTCPYPGINIPEVEDDLLLGTSKSYLRYHHVAMDANFRLKNQMISSYTTDPGLGIGMSYFVEREKYEEFILSKASSEDISTCVGFQALAKANTKSSAGLRYTGVAGVCCARSEMVLPNTVGNLQKGERYANMDYVFGSALKNCKQDTVVVGYDIACQWHTNLRLRMKDWPEQLRLDGITTRPVIGKLHEPAHKRIGHDQYSCNLAHGLGLGDFECLERLWAGNNGAANSTRMYGPGTRQDVLDDHFAFWNFEKYKNTGPTLMRRYKTSLKDRNNQRDAHQGFSATFDQQTLKEWEEMCRNWDEAPCPKPDSIPSPFLVASENLSTTEVLEELERASTSTLHETSEAKFIALGLELEQEQLRIRKIAKAKGDATVTDAGLKEERRALCFSIQGWIDIRTVYIPGIIQFLAAMERSNPSPSLFTEPENHPLWLPSSIPHDKRLLIVHSELCKIEDQLRSASCLDTLNGLRHLLRVKTRMIQFKNKHIRGQKDGLRSTGMIDRVNSNARELAIKYRHDRAAKLLLVGDGEWTKVFRVLDDGDVRAYTDPERMKERHARKGTVEADESNEPWVRSIGEGKRDSATPSADGTGSGVDLRPEVRGTRAGTGDTRKALSWIWTVEGSRIKEDWSELETGDHERAEWAKSRCRKNRATEEVEMVRDEMQRALDFADWMSLVWLERGELQQVEDPVLAEGLSAYAQEQSHVQIQLMDSWKAAFKKPLEDVDEEEQEDDEDEEDEDEDEAEDGDGGDRR